MAEGVRPLCSSLTLLCLRALSDSDRKRSDPILNLGVMGREQTRLPKGHAGVLGLTCAKRSAGGGRSLKRKSRHSGKFWFSEPKVRPDRVFGSRVGLIKAKVISA